jgi:DNA-binding XRE family transcriptional regulator
MLRTNEDRPDLKAIREELRISQATLASYLGVSVRTVQSCEQGWRCPGEAVKKALLLLLITYRRREELAELHCWDYIKCLDEQRERCLVYQSRQGHLCWFLLGNQCSRQPNRGWKEKREMCHRCTFFQMLIRPAGIPSYPLREMHFT